MSKSTSFTLLLASLSLAATAAGANAQSARAKTACELLSVAELRKIAGRNDLATRPERADSQGALSNCERPGAFDVTMLLGPSDRTRFARMKDTFVKAPARVGFTVEPAPGVGDDAYFAIRGERVQLLTLVGGRQLTIELKKTPGSDGTMPPVPEVKAIALKLGKAAAARMR